jgi:hypothetical protein
MHNLFIYYFSEIFLFISALKSFYLVVTYTPYLVELLEKLEESGVIK